MHICLYFQLNHPPSLHDFNASYNVLVKGIICLIINNLHECYAGMFEQRKIAKFACLDKQGLHVGWH
jgi:hypothetical protein